MNLFNRFSSVILLAAFIIAAFIAFFGMKEARSRTGFDFSEIDGREVMKDHPDYVEYRELMNEINKKGESPSALIELSKVCKELKKSSDSEKVLHKALSKNPGRADLYCEAHYRLGSLYLEDNRLDKAVEEVRLIEQAYPGANGVFELKGHIYFQMGDYQRARREYSGEYINATCTDSFVGIVNTYIMEKDYPAVEKVSRTGSVFDPECAFVLSVYGISFMERGLYKEAAEIFKKTVEMSPRDGINYSRLAESYRKSGDSEKALKYFREALKVDGRNREYAWGGIGYTLLDMADKERDRIPSGPVVLVSAILLIAVFGFFLFRRDIKAGGSVKEAASFTKNLEMKLIMFLIVTTVILTVLLSPDTGLKRKTKLSLEAGKAFKRAISLKENRKDFYEGLAASCVNTGNRRKAARVLDRAGTLPEFTIKNKLFFPF